MLSSSHVLALHPLPHQSLSRGAMCCLRYGVMEDWGKVASYGYTARKWQTWEGTQTILSHNVLSFERKSSGVLVGEQGDVSTPLWSRTRHSVGA